MMTLDEIVGMDTKQSQFLPWNKLNKSLKLKKVMEYADAYSLKENLDEVKAEQLKLMLKDKLVKKCLQRTKDVTYNKELQQIESIPALIYVHLKYTLRSEETIPLFSLAPKNKTVKKN
jgi:hypothetical protein